MNLTVLQLAMLCQLIYFDPPERVLCRVGASLTAGALARSVLADPPCRSLSREEVFALGQIDGCRALSGLRVAAYINDNDGNGFVGFAFQGSDGETLLGFRGSESTLSCAPSNIDWLDNVRAPLKGSLQYPSVRELARRFEPQGPLTFFGHSKGGHNALYALASSERQGDRCICFDAQGFAPGQLTRGQMRSLKERAVNYVQRRDVVGALLCHPETRLFVEETGEDNTHALTAMAYDLEGNPVPARRALSSVMIGLTSCLLARLLREAEGENAVPPLPAPSRNAG